MKRNVKLLKMYIHSINSFFVALNSLSTKPIFQVREQNVVNKVAEKTIRTYALLSFFCISLFVQTIR